MRERERTNENGFWFMEITFFLNVLHLTFLRIINLAAFGHGFIWEKSLCF